MNSEEILITFFQECDDQLQILEEGLSVLEHADGDDDTINSIFRAVHSIKGGAASFGLTRLTHFAHTFENALSALRSGDVLADATSSSVFLHATDILSDLVREARGEGKDVSDEKLEECSHQLAHIQSSFPSTTSHNQEPEIPVTFEPLPVELEFDETVSEPSISQEEGAGSQRHANDFFSHLDSDLGELRTKEDDARVRQEIDAVLGQRSKSPAQPKRSTPTRKRPVHGAESIRVNLDKVDMLMNLVGELVIAQSSLENTNSAQRAVAHMESLVRELQESVMSIRAQPVITVFQRMKRVVREASAATSKKVQLSVEGEETEIDRTLVEKLVDPLTHILRNAVDHGIEEPAVRHAANKPEQGHITLKAEQKSGRIVISIKDDCSGIHRQKVKAIAVQKGLIEDSETLSNEDIDNLICAPDFSTNEQVTDLSGRGVGMDVVKSVIQTLGGKMMIKSTPGKGTEFGLSMPLTLAVMDGMLIKTGGTVLVVPVSAISGIAQIDDTIKSVVTPDGRRITHVRGQTFPLVNMAEVLAFPTEGKEECLLITEDETGGGAAFEVDDIIDQKQVVIKSLEKNYHKITGVSGATILGDGSVALIIDPGALING